MKWLIAFDLDGTLAESKRPLSQEMAATLARLLAVTGVAVISGGDWPQFEKQVASCLPADAALDRLWLMPITGTKLYRRRLYPGWRNPEEGQQSVGHGNSSQPMGYRGARRGGGLWPLRHRRHPERHHLPYAALFSSAQACRQK
jgi:hypothetical protein|tara:strand:+ start:22514 stop:22945 length:432 start_codon:yes stop_codon:yes gene_type:complete